MNQRYVRIQIITQFNLKRSNFIQLQHLSRSLISTQSKQKQWDVIHATKLIKKLQINNYKHVIQLTETERERIVTKAFDIYNNTQGDKDHVLINGMLKLLLYFQHQYKIILIWDDIIAILSKQTADQTHYISWPLLLTCCIKSRDVDISKCVKVLQCLQLTKKTVKLHSSLLHKLIDKCHNKEALHSLQFIHSLLCDAYICCTDGKTHFIKTALIIAYGKCLSITSALDVFHSFNKHEIDVVAIVAMMNAYVKNEEYEEALVLYDNVGLELDDICHTMAIKAAKNMNDYEKGTQIADKIISQITAETHAALLNSLIDFYGHSLQIQTAIDIYNAMSDDKKDIITINAMMTAYVKSSGGVNALELYDEIALNEKYKLNEISHIVALNACGDANMLTKGKEIHDKIRHLLADNVIANTALIDMYGKCGDLNNAVDIFNNIDCEKNIICINVMLAAYVTNRANSQCIELFKHILANTSLSPTLTSYQILFRACTNGTSFYFGQAMHDKLKQNFYQNKSILNDTSIIVNLINMYAKCGMLHICEDIFNKLRKYDFNKYRSQISIWNAMIHSHGKLGNFSKAKQLYDSMQNETDLVANDKTYMALLIACSYSGDDGQAQEIWQQINVDVRYNCYVIAAFVDCLSRKGSLRKAFEIIIEYETSNEDVGGYDDVMWGSLLNGCIKYKDQDMAETVYNEMILRFKGNKKYDARMAAASVMLRNIYASNGEYDKVKRIRNLMKVNGWKKEPGFSEIDVYGKLHKFYAGNEYLRNVGEKEKEYALIDSKLGELCEKFKSEHGYEHNYSLVTRELRSDETEEYVLWRHSEKIALSFGLLSTANEYVIVINKNLRICSDCHDFVRLASLTENRKIIVSDANRVHVFENGVCSCNEFY